MSYQYTEFDDVSLPLYDHKQNHAGMPSEATLRDSIGGAYDWRGADRKAGRKQIINGGGKYFGEITYLVDELGDRILDEDDNPIISGDAVTTLAAEVRALMEKKGTRGQLWRRRLADDVLQWKTARLLEVDWPRKVEDHAIIAEVTYRFETLMEWWHADVVTETAGNASSGVPLELNVSNSGMTAEDAVITITRSSGTITQVVITATGVSLKWVGSLGAADVLEIDCGRQTVRENGVDAYSGFTLESGHTVAGWLPLLPGASLIDFTVTGGNATCAVEHYNQYA